MVDVEIFLTEDSLVKDLLCGAPSCCSSHTLPWTTRMNIVIAGLLYLHFKGIFFSRCVYLCVTMLCTARY